MVIIVKDVLFSERNLRKICLHLVLKMEFSKILPSHPMTIPTLLMLLESHSLAIKTPVKILTKSPQINHHCCYGCGDPLEGIFCHKCTCELCGNGVHYGYNYPSKVPIIPDPEPFNNQTIKELPPTVQSFNPKSNLVHDSPNVFDPPSQLPLCSCEFCENDARLLMKLINEEEKQIEEDQAANARYWKIPTCYNDDDDYTFAITPNEPNNSLSMGDEHLDTIPATESDEFIKSSVENLVPNPSVSEGEYEFIFYEDFLKEIYSNPLFNEEIITIKMNQHHFNAEYDLIESLLNHDSSIISSSKMDSLFDEFAGELTFLKAIPPGIDETDCDPKEETHFIKRLLYGNSSFRPPKEFVSVNSDATIESFFPTPIPVEDSDSHIEEIDLSFTPDYPMPTGIEEEDYDSERDILILDESLSNDSLSLPENESFHFDIPLFSRPSTKPPDGNTRILDVKLMGDISEQKPSVECPMMIHGKNNPILDVSLFHFYPHGSI
uniref:Reverse transcriptase domain-containing protein n=1 Tax=Tanacetum cinerariifolium TaxID=118510 RepID=A0A699JBR8_TANCI|nr:hypothetical protein [Tanacetum cinerariifolium]